GWGRPDTANDPVSLASVPLLDLPDPSQRGSYTVVAAAYGSGNELRRPELGQDVLWRTAVVDASGVLPRRGFLARSYAAWLWGFDDAHIPVHGLVWYPAEPDGPLPLVLIAHGNRVSSAYSERGYAYLGEHLASHGMIAVSVDENYLNGDALFDYRGEEYPLRAWLLLRHVDQFRMWNDLPDHPLSGRVDLDRVALIGHSRGGEAAALAAEFAAGRTPPAGLPPAPPGISVRAVIGIAPTEGQFRGAPIRLTDVDYLVIQGAHDAELPAFWGLATYHRVQFTGADRRIKVALLSQRANHGRFNSVWNDADAGLASWMLDRVSILSPAEQQQLTRAVVLAFLRRSLFDDRAYDAFFREPRSGRHWLPDDVILSHWETSDRIDIADFDVGGLITRTFDASGFDVAILRDPELRDRTFQGDLALYLRWSRPATVQVNLDPGTSARVDPAGRLTLSIFADSGGSLPDPVVEVRAGGESAAVRLGTVVPFRPLPRPRVWKNDTLAKRYVREAPPPGVVERFLQTYAIELSHFTAVNPDLDLTALEAVLLHFDGAGSAFLDDLGFEPAD
ncbi:MAG TPA: hypothetical protein VNZ57_13395, partial [Longimicrobiales bacterium]|nr:hypothetical protein [Longimicrobiales bacterium]